MLKDLAERGVARLLVEGGERVLGEFLAAGLADQLDLAVAPFFLGDPAPATAPRLRLSRPDPASPMTLAGISRVGEVALLRYLLGPGGPDHRFLRWAVELSRLCPPSDSAFSVGAVVVGEDGDVLATGFSREQEDHDHAEEVALRKLGPDPRLRHATVYSSLVPCGARASRPVTCVRAHRRGGHPAGRLRLARAPPVHRRRGGRTAPGRRRRRHRGARTSRTGPRGQRPPRRKPVRLAWGRDGPRAVPHRRAPHRRARAAPGRHPADRAARRGAPPDSAPDRPGRGRRAQCRPGGLEPSRGVVFARRPGGRARRPDSARAPVDDQARRGPGSLPRRHGRLDRRPGRAGLAQIPARLGTGQRCVPPGHPHPAGLARPAAVARVPGHVPGTVAVDRLDQQPQRHPVAGVHGAAGRGRRRRAERARPAVGPSRAGLPR